MTYTEQQVAERDAATKKWQDAMAKWQIAANIEAHGGPPAGPKPAYDGPTNLIEPNSAGAASAPGGAGGKADGGGAESAFDNGNAPVQHVTLPNNDSGGGATPSSAVGTAGFDSDHQRAVDAYNKLMLERDGAGNYKPPTVQTRDVNAPDQVDTRLIGAADINDTAGQEIRGQQVGYLDALKARMEGRGPSVAEEQEKRALDTIAQQQSGLAAQAHGNAGVFARREAMRNTADAQQKTSLDAALLRATESAQSAGQLGGALQGVRATDTETAIRQADLNQDASKANQGESGLNGRFNSAAKTAVDTGNANRDVNVQTGNQSADITTHGQNIGEKQGLANEAITASGQADTTTGRKAETDIEAKRLESQERATKYAADKQKEAAIVGAAATTGAGLLEGAPKIVKEVHDIYTSDARAKKDIKPDSKKDRDEFLNALQEVSFRYRDPSADGAGERHGVLAQDLEKSRIGRSVVKTDARGMKVVDTDALTMALAGVLASVAKEKRRAR